MIRSIASAALLALLNVCAQAETQWFRIDANGAPVGMASSERTVRGDQIKRVERHQLKIARDAQVIELDARAETVESRDGKPLKFANDTRFSGFDVRTRGRVLADGRIEIERNHAGAQSTETLPANAALKFPDAIERALKATGFKPGAKTELVTFLTDAGLYGTESVEVLAPIERDGQRLHRVRSTVRAANASETSNALYLADGTLHAIELELLGSKLTLTATTKADARAAVKGAGAWQILDAALLAIPAAAEVGETTRDQPRQIIVAGLDSSVDVRALNTAEQRVSRRDAQTVVFDVRATPSRSNDPPTAALRSANAWIQSDQAALKALAKRGLRGVNNEPLAQMQALERLVAAHITTKDLSQGYASALEAARTRRGDCTEHALLLAALGRARGIPTRIAAGFAYAPSFAGKSQVLVPHAWTQAYIDGAWRSFDAALGRFDTRRFALSFGNGEPWDFAGAMAAQQSLRVERIEVVE
jgi:hypothetical protein